MPPKRSGAQTAHGRLKKHRIKVLSDDIQSNIGLPPSSSTRTFAVRRLASGRKGQKRAQISSCFHEQADNAPIAGDPDVNVGALSLGADDSGISETERDIDFDIDDISGDDGIHRIRRRKKTTVRPLFSLLQSRSFA